MTTEAMVRGADGDITLNEHRGSDGCLPYTMSDADGVLPDEVTRSQIRQFGNMINETVRSRGQFQMISQQQTAAALSTGYKIRLLQPSA